MKLHNKNELNIPSLEDFRFIYKKGVFDDISVKLTEEDIYLCQFYKYLVADHFHRITEFDNAEKAMRDNSYKTKSGERMSYFQKYNELGFDYFSLLSAVRVDRLPENVRRELLSAMEDLSDERKLTRAKDLAVSYIPDVLMIDKSKENTLFLLFDSVRGEGRIPGNSIIMEFSSDASFDDDGNYISFDEEQKRKEMLYEQKAIIENAYLQKTGYKLTILVNA